MKLALLAFCTAPLFTVAATDFTSTYSEGETRTTTFSLETSSETTEVEMIVNGRANSDDMNQSQEVKRSATYTDLISKVDDGVATEFTRTYEDLVSEVAWLMTDRGGEHELNGSGDSELEDIAVVFTKDDDGYTRSFPEGETNDGDLLEGLSPHLNWAGFLPDEDAEIGAEWEIEPALLREALHLGGALSFDGVGDEDSVKVLQLTHGIYLGVGHEIDGDITAKLTEIEDGLATIELAIEYSELMDLGDLIQELSDQPEGQGPDTDSMTHETEYEGVGTLIWDVEGGFAVSFSIELDYENEQKLKMSSSMGDRTMEMEQNIFSEGELKLEIEVEVTSK